MATALAGLSGATAIPYVGWLIGIGAAVIDAKYIMPGIAGKGRAAAKSPRLQGVPVGSNEAGAPRIWAIGGRGVRVPTHILWQKSKTREAQASRNKAGTDVQQKQVLVDCLLALNDRETFQMMQLVGNGKLLVWESRNLVRITTHEMSAAVSGANVVITMANVQTQSPTDHFAVGDFAKFYGFVNTAGSNLNATYWRISALTGHTSVPGTITLQPVDGQTLASFAANGGSPFTPSHIERVDDALLFDPATVIITQPNPAFGDHFIEQAGIRNPNEVFNVRDKIRIVNAAPGINTLEYVVASFWSQTAGTYNVQVGQANNAALTPLAGGTTWLRLEFFSPTNAATGFFATGFVPSEHYHSGSEDQGEDAILVAEKGTGNVPGYRGMAYQSIDDFVVTDFGGQLPYSLEAILRPHHDLTWGQACQLVLLRAGIPENAIDVTGIDPRPFLGFYIRGAVPTATAIQPILLAGQIVGQERDGAICLFEIPNADVVQIENGPERSALGAHIFGEAHQDNKITTENDPIEDLPTSVGVRHQNPDNVFADDYQFFGLRNPNGVEHENRQEVDVSNLVLSRKEATNLAATTVRRAWVNNRKRRYSLDARYLDLLENDLNAITDDDGNDITTRIIQRDRGANFLVSITAVDEDVNLAVHGSPIQSGSGLPPPIIITPPVLTSLVLDMPSLEDSENNRPMLRFVTCANRGGHWAGCRVFESFDGTNWTMVETISEQSVIGALLGDIPDVVGESEVYGSPVVTFLAGAVDVQFECIGAYGIASCTQTEAKAGRNWCVFIGADGRIELAAFTSATATATPLAYTLDGWLRGLRGTPVVSWTTGTRFVVLGPRQECPSVVREFPGLVQPVALLHKFVPVGLTVEDVDPVATASTWANCRPLPLRVLTKVIGSSPFDARFITEHWTKEHLPLGTLPPYSMDEPFEGYRFTIWDPSGNAVRRTKIIQANPSTGAAKLRDKWVDYPASEQTADGYTPSGAETFIVDVQQIGAFGLSDSIKQEV